MKKIGNILLAVLPGLMLTAFTFIVSQVVQVIVTVKYVAGGGSADPEALVAYLTDFLQGDRLLVVVIIAQLLTVLISILILVKGMKKKEVLKNGVYAVKGMNGISIVITMVALELASSFALFTIGLLAPDALEGYSSLINQSGLAGLTVISTIATVLIAPLCEEIVFRGLTVKILEKTGWNFWIVNFIQAAFFGIYHLNLVQGIYAFVLGFVLGIIAKRFKTIWASILGHAVFNFSGTYLITFVSQFIPEKVIVAVILLLLALLLAAAGLYLLFTKGTAPEDTKAEDTLEVTTAE